MDDKLNGKPVTFDHPEKLIKGVSLEEGDVEAKTFINEVNGQVKVNIVIENKNTGEIAKKDEVIGEIVKEENVDSDSHLGLGLLAAGAIPGAMYGAGTGVGVGLGFGLDSDVASRKD
ncbi:hypothetical protein [Clostridium lacusfryxellense]|uniref:hypothetical protein n=1 Tax=Clostridium lacusfryxellense TaxID=205328 RepID=UPI001C0C4192|nr:hypothetical protein [Clostridium lacusfryxellense]MBU3114153.1 hypothetical protein [Clostridium lacusfryxellense]